MASFKLELKPIDARSLLYYYYNNGMTLPPDLCHHLQQKSNLLTSHWLDMLGYNLTKTNVASKQKHTFLQPSNAIDPQTSKQFCHRLILCAENKPHGMTCRLSREQFLLLLSETPLHNCYGRPLTALDAHELMHWHDNHMLEGNPELPGGDITSMYFFQMYNTFGTVFYRKGALDHDVDDDILLYLEDMEDRTFTECITLANSRINLNMTLAKLQPQGAPTPRKEDMPVFTVVTPRLILQPTPSYRY